MWKAVNTCGVNGKKGPERTRMDCAEHSTKHGGEGENG